ncbi:MAG: MG2 domain-containing protein [Candidatus Bathyarchaeia archaeon]
MGRPKVLFHALSYIVLIAIILTYIYSIEASSYFASSEGCWSENSCNTPRVLGAVASSDGFLKISVYTNKSTYFAGEDIAIFGYTSDSLNNPVENARVGIEVRDPNNSTIFLDIVYSNPEGYYTDRFKLREDALPGTYRVHVSASAAGYASAYNQTIFTVQTAAIHDIEILSITFDPTNPAVNQTITISVEVSNLGNCVETFDLYLNYTRLADPQIGKQTVTLSPGEKAILNFTWTPDAAGRYQILAYTGDIPWDIDLTNNRKESVIYVSSTGSAQTENINERLETNLRFTLRHHFRQAAFSTDSIIR